MRTKIGLTLVFIIGLAVGLGIAWAQSVPQLINYQGRLTNAAGQPLADGATVDLTFAFYGVQSGATPLYLTVLQEDVVVTGGIYNVLIGSGTITPGAESTLAAVFQKHSDVWLGVKVDLDDEMTPRSRITSVPYAMAVDANLLDQWLNNKDEDGDGHYKPSSSNNPHDDCNDNNANVYLGAKEICDYLDNNCNGFVDEQCTPGMALIPSGCFNMGDAFSEGGSDELPVHNVCITSDFYMDVNEVTNAEYAACVCASGCTAPGDSSSYSRGSYYGNPTYHDFPVIYVSWNQATAYCTWAGKRLPTEAEWEYAARGGLSGQRYPWGDTISGSNANYMDSGDPWDNDTSQVAYYPANGYGLYDMAGNVFEWVNDWYLSTYYSVSPTNDPPGPASGTYRVLRGGSWNINTYALRVAYRMNRNPTNQFYYLGFRCVGD